MVTNPCCMPLNSGVKIVTHLSLAIAVAVVCMGTRLISISSEVSSEVTNNPALQYQQQQQYNLRSQFRDEILWKSYLQEASRTRSISQQDESDQAEIFLQTLRNLSFTPAPADLREYAKVSLICGLMAISSGFFQFLTSSLLLCFINRDSKSASMIWVAVNLSVLFCLSTCLALFLCFETSIPMYVFDEQLFLILLTIDILLSIYFIWVVMAFI